MTEMAVHVNYKEVKDLGLFALVKGRAKKGSKNSLQLPEGESRNLSQMLLGWDRR